MDNKMYIKGFIGTFYCGERHLVVADAFNTKLNAALLRTKYTEPIDIVLPAPTAFDVFALYTLSDLGCFMDYIVCRAVETRAAGIFESLGSLNLTNMKAVCVCPQKHYGQAGKAARGIEEWAHYSMLDILEYPECVPPQIVPLISDKLECAGSCPKYITGKELLLFCADVGIDGIDSESSGLFKLNTNYVRSTHFVEEALRISESPEGVGMIFRGTVVSTNSTCIPIFADKNGIIIISMNSNCEQPSYILQKWGL